MTDDAELAAEIRGAGKALREVIREARESDDVHWHFVERIEFILGEIEEGRL